MRRRPRFADVVSVLALFAALGGGAYAAVKLEADSVGSKQVRKDSLTGADIKEGKLGRVPSAASADSAANAGLLDGVDSAALARRGLEWTPVAEAHQSSSPPGRFTCFGSDGVVCDSFFGSYDGSGEHAEAAFSRDGFGIVRLAGSIAFTHPAPGLVNPGAIFDLPLGYRPPDRRVLLVLRNGSDPVRLDVGPDGAVELDQPYQSSDWFSLDGVEFPCGPRGLDGCP